MPDSLDFDLSLSYKRALKELDDFVRQAKDKLDKVTFDPAIKQQSRRDSDFANRIRDQERREREAIERSTAREIGHQERLTQIREQAAARMAVIESRSGQHLLTERAATEARITQIVANANNRRIADIQRAVSHEINLFRQAARAKAAEAGGSMSGGKNLQYVFQAQQAVEDFSYAGLRGASNNIAFMASQLGGPAGLIALLATMGVTLTPIIAKLLSTSDAADQNSRSFDRLKGSIDSAFGQRADGWWNSDQLVESSGQLKRFEQDVLKTQQTLSAIGDEKSSLESVQQLLTKYADLRDTVSHVGFGGMLGSAGGLFGPTYSFEAEQRQLDAIIRQVSELQHLGEFAGMDLIQIDLQSTDQVRDLIGQITDKLDERIVKERELKRLLTEQSAAIERSRDAAQQIAANRKEAGLDPDEKFKHEMITDPILHGDDPAKKLTDKFKKEAESLEKMIEFSVENAPESVKPLMDTLKLVTEEYKKQLDLLKMVDQAEKESLQSAKEAVREQERKNNELQTEIDAREAIIEKLPGRQFKDDAGFEEKKFDAQKSANDNIYKEMAEKAKQNIHPLLHPKYKEMLSKQIDEYYANLNKQANAFLSKQQNAGLMKQAKAAGGAGEFDEQRTILQRLRDQQLQNVATAQNPQQAQYWMQQANMTQKQILDTYQQQKQFEQEKIQGLQDQIQSVDALKDKIKQMEQDILKLPKVDITDPAVQTQLQIVNGELAKMAQLIAMINGLKGAGNLGETFMGGFGALFGGARAAGGRMNSGAAYLVGEEGPEMVIPNRTGFVLDARTTGALLSYQSGHQRAMSQTTNYSSQMSSVMNQQQIFGGVNLNVSGGSNVSDMYAAARREAASLAIRRGR